MTKKTKMALAVGFAVFVVGAGGAAYMGTSRTGTPTATSGSTAFYATGPIGAGTSAAAALSQGLLRAKSLGATPAPAQAVTDPAQLSGGLASRAITAGTLITADMFVAPKTRIGTVVIPPGRRALTVKLAPVAGVAGFAGAGDHIDIYAVKKSAENGPNGVRLVVQGIEVLSVNGTGLTAAPGQPNGPDLVYLLAVTPAEAERLIYLSTFEMLYFDLVAAGEPPVGPTPGASAAQALQV